MPSSESITETLATKLGPHPRVWYLSGPTASGKSAVGLELARTLNAEIVSLDSMALFRRLDIGTAKPSAAERNAIPHHLLDVVDPHEEFSLASYLELAEQAEREILSRGKQVLFVGGTPLYLKARLRGVFAGPPADWELRTRLAALPADELHARLAAVDPLSAARLHVADQRRVIRALEVYEKLGQSITLLQQQFDQPQPREACRVFVLDWPREVLHRRIDARVEAMVASGWLEEVRQLLSEPLPLGRTASQAVGYRELMEHLRGKRSLAETIVLIQQRTRQFAKRQMTWFRSLEECRFLPLAEPFDPWPIAERIVALAAPSAR